MSPSLKICLLLLIFFIHLFSLINNDDRKSCGDVLYLVELWACVSSDGQMPSLHVIIMQRDTPWGAAAFQTEVKQGTAEAML